MQLASGKTWPPEAYTQRSDLMRDRMRRFSSTNAGAISGQLEPPTTNKLLDFQFGGGVPGDDLIMVDVEVHKLCTFNLYRED